MPTATKSGDVMTLNDRDDIEVTINTDADTLATRVSAKYEIGVAGQATGDVYVTGSGAGVVVRLMRKIAPYIKRKLPFVAGGARFATDTTAIVAASVTVNQVSVDTSTCQSTTSATINVGTVSIVDTFLRVSALTSASLKALTKRGLNATLPRKQIPASVYIYAENTTDGPFVGLDVNGEAVNQYTVEAGTVCEVNMSFERMNSATNNVTVNVGNQTFINTFSDCVSYVALAKEREGGFVAVGFSRKQEQPTSVPANIRTIQPSPLANPVQEGDLQGRVIELFRDGIKWDERDTYAAFVAGTSFWFWNDANGEYVPAQLTSASAIDYKTNVVRITLTLQDND